MKGFRVKLILTLAVLMFASGCDSSGSGGSGGGGGTGIYDGYVTFSDGAPGGTTVVCISTITVNNAASFENAYHDYVASGVVRQTDEVGLFDAGGNFDKNGTYTVLYVQAGVEKKYKNSVKFTNGRITIAKSGMSGVPY